MSNLSTYLGRKIIEIYIALISFNILVWGFAISAFLHHPVLLSTAVLAYSLGLRHAVDADHIAAIDNVTRKLMQEGKRPLTIGLFFSLGHSTTVFIACIGIAFATLSFTHRYFSQFQELGKMICTSLSAFFLFLIAALNLIIFFSIYQIFAKVRKGLTVTNQEIDLSNSNVFFSRKIRSLFAAISNSWQMYFIGFIFALCFDTATEIALLGITSSQSIELSFISLLIFPSLFTAGMMLIDTTDNILMLGAYGWAFTKPVRKLYYNLTITFISVVVALCIGCLELLGLISIHFNMQGKIWTIINALNNQSGVLGYVIIFVFVLSWMISIALYRLLGLEKIDTH
jgi:high-affinity nickel-transport protein